MKALMRFAVVGATALFLLSPLAEKPAAAEARVTYVFESNGESAKLTETDEQLTEQIRSTYKKAKKTANRKSFKGKCGYYVGLQLLKLGINTKYVGSNGNRAFDIYKDKTETSGGYEITAYSAKKYTLREAIEAIERNDPHARNILVGFEKGTSKAGKKYGHVMFIHGIEDGMVYFSDSYAQTVDGKRYKEGEPIVCSIETFAQRYKKYKLDGVIHFH
ncbi:MAG: hypothetical protein II049_02690 [Clostridia bacterium]|nr:hypothetical protein [Clostridia bacterium]